MVTKFKRWLLAFVGGIYARLLPKGKRPIWMGGGRGRRRSGASSADVDDGPPVDFSPVPDNRWGSARSARLKLDRTPGDGTTLYLSHDDQDDEDPNSDSPHWVEVGNPGTRYATGLPVGHEKNEYFAPVKVRGQSGDVGKFRQLGKSSPTFRRGLSTIGEGLSSIPWREWDGNEPVRNPDRVWEWRITPSDDSHEARRRAKMVEKNIQNLKDGWRQFIHEWLTALIDGFVIFEPVFYGPGEDEFGLFRKLGFREQSTVERWIFDEYERELLGVQFATSERRYTLGAHELAIYSHRRTGVVWEGDPPIRSVARHIEAVQHYHQTSLVSAEAYGVPWMYSEVDPDVAGQLDDETQQTVEDEVTSAKASQRPFLQLPFGVGVRTTSPGSKQPDFTGKVDQHREMILNSLKAEGAMMGVNSVGAKAAREVADDESLRQIPHYGRLLLELFNTAPGLPYDGLLQLATDRRWGGPVGDEYMQLELHEYQEEDENEASDWVALADAGLVEKTPEVKKDVHRRYDLPVPEETEDGAGTGAGAGETSTAGAGQASGEGGGGLEATEGDGFDSVYVELKLQANTERAERGFDQAESLARRALESVATQHREWARDQIESVSSSDDLISLESSAESRFLPKYREELESAYTEAAKGGAVDVGRDFGVTVADDPSEVQLSKTKKETIRSLAHDRASEMFDRQQGLINETARERISGGDAKRITGLASSTVANIGGRGAGTAYRQGRTEVTERANEIGKFDGEPTIMAERINPIDESTCPVCNDVHGEQAEVGSDRYEALVPPGRGSYQCEAPGHCRCILTYIPPAGMDTSTFEAVLTEKLR